MRLDASLRTPAAGAASAEFAAGAAEAVVNVLRQSAQPGEPRARAAKNEWHSRAEDEEANASAGEFAFRSSQTLRRLALAGTRRSHHTSTPPKKGRELIAGVQFFYTAQAERHDAASFPPIGSRGLRWLAGSDSIAWAPDFVRRSFVL